MGRAEREAAVDGAVAALERARVAVAAGSDGGSDGAAGSDGGGEGGESVAGVVHGAGDMMVAVRAVAARSSAAAVTLRAEQCYDRAARQSGVGQPRRWGPVAAGLRSAAWRLAAIRTLGDPRHRDAGVAELLVAIAALIARGRGVS